MSNEELRKQIEQDTKDHNARLDRQAIKWLENQERLAKRMIKDNTMNDNDPRWQELNDKLAKVQAELEHKKLMDKMIGKADIDSCWNGLTANSKPWSGNIPIPPSREKWIKKMADLGVQIDEAESMKTQERCIAGVDYLWVTDEELPPQPIQYSKVEPEPDNNLPPEHQAHIDFHKSVIDNYEAYKLIEVLTEILDEVRAINKKLKKKVKK